MPALCKGRQSPEPGGPGVRVLAKVRVGLLTRRTAEELPLVADHHAPLRFFVQHCCRRPHEAWVKPHEAASRFVPALFRHRHLAIRGDPDLLVAGQRQAPLVGGLTVNALNSQRRGRLHRVDPMAQTPQVRWQLLTYPRHQRLHGPVRLRHWRPFVARVLPTWPLRLSRGLGRRTAGWRRDVLLSFASLLHVLFLAGALCSWLLLIFHRPRGCGGARCSLRRHGDSAARVKPAELFLSQALR